MIETKDIITWPFTPDLTEAGIAYACKSLAYTYNRMGGSDAERLRRITAGKAVELAFRRLLAQQQTPFDNLGTTRFSDPDQYDVALGGRRCDLKSAVLLHKSKIQLIRRQPEALLEAAALVPDDQLLADHFSEHDLFIFAFASALTTQRAGDVQRAVAANQRVHYVYTLPPAWSQPENWHGLGHITFKLEQPPGIRLEVGGQNQNRMFTSEVMELSSGTRHAIRQEYSALAYLHTNHLPAARVGMHSALTGETLLVQPQDWENIWVYGMEIYFAGWIQRGEFRQRAKALLPGSRAFPYDRTRTSNHALRVGELYPLAELFEAAKAFGGKSV